MKPGIWATLLVVVSLLPLSAPAQTAVELTAEPHHHLLLQNDQVRVFGFALKPGEQAYVKHEHNFLFTMLDDCQMVLWSEGQSPITSFIFKQGDTRLFYSGAPRGYRNDQTQTCRGAIVEFLDPKVTTYGFQADGQWGYGPTSIGNPVDPRAKFKSELALGTASVAYVQLLAGDSFPAPEKGVAELLIPVTDVDFKTQGDIHLRKSPGEATWLGEGRKSDLENASGAPLRFLMVQLQVAPPK